MKDTSERGRCSTPSAFDQPRGALRNLPTMSQLNELKIGTSAGWRVIMAASARFRHLRNIALFASLITIPVAPAFAQTLSYQPVDHGLAFPQYAPQAQQPSDVTQSTDQMPAALRRQVVSYQGNEAAGTVIVDTAHTYLYLILGGGQAMRYGIGVGREGFTWSGTQTITRKAEWPDWTPPPEMIARQPYL